MPYMAAHDSFALNGPCSRDEVSGKPPFKGAASTVSSVPLRTFAAAISESIRNEVERPPLKLEIVMDHDAKHPFDAVSDADALRA
jgi:hypothetical protein